MSDEIKIEIDGRELTAKPSQTVIQVADEAGIYIPRFCYHKNLSIPANCRMCLVEIEKKPKTLPACSTPVEPGMKVFTKSRKTIFSQRAVMEFLLINHPLDCPICDQGGECELQDLSMGYGSSHSRYTETKRAVFDQDFGPLISTEMTRCIYCTRCVRFGDEVAGVREIGAIGRGEFTEISTYITHAIRSEVSGNIIDLCPVGALTSKPFRFRARAWELDEGRGISPHDCLGSNLNIHTRYGKVMRVVARENKDINEVWISDRDRFSYSGLYHKDRLEEPIAKFAGEWRPVTWQQAFEIAANGIRESIAQHGIDKLGALASPSSTLEEFYLLQKIVRGLGSPHIDHRLREVDTRDQSLLPIYPHVGISLSELEQCDAILLIGSNIRKEQPLASLRVRKAALKGAFISAVNPVDFSFNFELSGKKIVAPHLIPQTLISIGKALKIPEITDFEVDIDDEAQAIANQLLGKSKVAILLGALAWNHNQASLIRYLAHQIAKASKATIGALTEGANSMGGWLAGAIPHRLPGGVAINHSGLNAYEMLAKPRKTYLLLNVEPDLDCANAMYATKALQQAQCVVALSIYHSPLLKEHAHVIFPMSPFTETSGTFINAMGDWQSFTAVANKYKASRPGWQILRVLGGIFGLADFDYEHSEQIKHEIKAQVEKTTFQPCELSPPSDLTLPQVKLSRIGEIPLYSIDSLVRRALPLQAQQANLEGELIAVRIHPKTARQLDVKEGEIVEVKQHSNYLELPVIYDTRIALDAAFIPAGINATVGLGDLMGELEIKRLNK